MDRIFMDEYYEHLRADNIEELSKERNDEYVGRDEEYKAAKSALLEGLGLEHLFDHSHELTPKEKAIWMLFDRVYVAELLARDAFATKILFGINVNHSSTGRCCAGIITMAYTAFCFICFIVFPFHFRADKFHRGNFAF